jgi:hypothetical protein
MKNYMICISINIIRKKKENSCEKTSWTITLRQIIFANIVLPCNSMSKATNVILSCDVHYFIPN